MKPPTLPVLGQVLGLAAFLAGLFLLSGVAVTLLVGGPLVTGWFTLVEATAARAAASERRDGPNERRVG